MARGRVITLDALGTLVSLDDPVPRLVAGLAARGAAVTEAQAGAALAEEIAFYRAGHDAAVDATSLARLRARCAAVLRAGLERAGADVRAVDAPALVEALLGALRFEPYAEVPGVLAELRAAGHRLIVVSNWDVSLHEMLDTTGLRALVDGAISSAEAGARKPEPALFRRALALAGARVGDRAGDRRPPLHAGDSLELDVAGARAAGLEAVLVARDGVPDRVPAGVVVLESLDGLAALAA
ncbi:MAG TPA: HAD family hydrolase [Solirubrobacteraceae bacterium]|nr:HAD family hydrolase [Solirubrobacteraceae bacterium]